MNANPPPLRPREKRPVIKCSIVYDNLAAGLRGRHFTEKLAARLGGVCDHGSLWRSDLVWMPKLAEQMRRESEQSHFVLFSFAGAKPLSAEFRCWLESWVNPAGGHRFSIVVLFAPRARPDLVFATRDYLRNLSEAAGVPFFAHCPLRTARVRPAPQSKAPQIKATHKKSHAEHSLFASAASSSSFSFLSPAWP